MMDEGKQLLILDCRSEQDYEQSKINYKYTVNVPENIIQIGMTAAKIHTSLPNDSKVFWELRKIRPYIIFVDWESYRFDRNSSVWHLKEILMHWDIELQEMEKQPEMLLLEGGYKKCKIEYPMKCFNPDYSSGGRKQRSSS